MEAYYILCDKIEPGNPANKSYDELVTIMREHYEPAPLEIIENYRFRLRTQKEGESIQEFVAALQRLSINCKFGPYLSTALRNQFVFGLQKPQIQSRLLETADLTWAKAVEKASAMEISMRDAAQLHKSNTTTGTIAKLDNAGNNRTSFSNKYNNYCKSKVDDENKHTVKTKTKLKCFRCGSDTHLANTCDKKKKKFVVIVLR